MPHPRKVCPTKSVAKREKQQADPLTKPELTPAKSLAESFAAEFQVGGDPEKIHPVDSCGVALAAIKGLLSFVRQQEAEILRLEKAVARSRCQLATLNSSSRGKGRVT